MVYARASGLVRVPEVMNPIDAAPLLCAGSPRSTRCVTLTPLPAPLVAIQGIGGLGHLGVQYAKQLGYRTVAIARGPEKEELARSLGADDYIDSAAVDPGAALQDLGGAAVIVATAASGASMSPLVAGLAPRGQLVVVGRRDRPDFRTDTSDLIFGGRSIVGSLTGILDRERGQPRVQPGARHQADDRSHVAR